MELEKYQELARLILESEEEKSRKSLFDDIDTAIRGGNDLLDIVPDLDMDWFVEYKSASVHDAYAAARKVMSSSKLQITVLPPFANEMNAKEAGIIEDVLEYNLWLTNRKSAKRPLDIIADHAVRYLAVAMEVIDNDFQYKGESSARVRAIKRSGRFTWKLFHPGEAHPRFSDSIMEDILLTQKVTVQQVVDKFGEKLTAKIVAETKEKNKKADLYETTGILYTYYDYEDHVEWFSFDENINGGTGNDYEILNKKHKLGFIPIVCAYGNDPILKAVVDTGQLDNLNILLSMRTALITATVAQARTWTKTASGEGVHVDYTNPAAQVQLKLNEEIGQMNPAQTDPNINTVIAHFEQGIANSTSVSRILSSMDSMASGTPYSTINTLLQTARESLVDIRNLIEHVIEGALCIEMYWSKYSKTAIMGQRMKNVGMYDDTKMMGAMLSLNPQESDDWPDKWIITVQLRPNSPSDRQERLNFAINSGEKMFLPRKAQFEIAGIDDDPAVSLMEYGDEQEEIAKIQANSKRILLAPEMEAKQALAQQQQQQQQQQQPASMGRTPATGGIPPAMSNPGATREQITGQPAQMTDGGG